MEGVWEVEGLFKRKLKKKKKRFVKGFQFNNFNLVGDLNIVIDLVYCI